MAFRYRLEILAITAVLVFSALFLYYQLDHDGR